MLWRTVERETWVVCPHLGRAVRTGHKGERTGCMSSLGFPPASPFRATLGKPLEGGMAFSLQKHWLRYTLQSFDIVRFKGNVLQVISLVVLRCVRLSFIKPGLRRREAEQLWVGAVPK